jgi:ADP-ribose pyrophosphatase YjhB (NUDIX family)
MKRLKHPIQRYIIQELEKSKYRRFRDLRPAGVDTNLYSYHLKLLQKQHIVVKEPDGYTFDVKAALKIDELASDTDIFRRKIPVLVQYVVQNGAGDILLSKLRHQPFADQWTLPSGAVHDEAISIEDFAMQVVNRKLGVESIGLEHAGDCYIRIISNDEVLTSTFVHVFRFESDAIIENDYLKWARPHKLMDYNLAPCVEQVMTRAFFRDTHFFEEFTESW